MTNQGFDNSGRLISETTTMITGDRTIITVTQYGYRGNERYVIGQNVNVVDRHDFSKSSSQWIQGGKILP